ncbi:MAG: sulfurtransferase complex subunit TusC [Thalassotalea sp.]
MKNIAIVNSKVPFANNAGKDALDLALIFGSYEQNVSLFFHDEGVWQLINNQQPEQISQKDYLKTFAAFELYDIDHVYVCRSSLSTRSLNESFHIDDVTVLNEADFYQKLLSHDVIFRF